jgi:anti-sigma factor RsiW
MIGRLLARRRFMRDHRFAQSRMSEYVDGDLPSEERLLVEEHVGICPQCRRMLATLKRTIEGLHGLGAPRRPGLEDRILDRLRHP